MPRTTTHPDATAIEKMTCEELRTARLAADDLCMTKAADRRYLGLLIRETSRRGDIHGVHWLTSILTGFVP